MKLHPVKPSRREMIYGGIYLTLFVLVLPWLVPMLAARYLPRLNSAQVNFIYFTLNFAATTVIFRSFFLNSLKAALDMPFRTLWSAALGYLGSQTLSMIVVILILRIYPSFANVNNVSVTGLVRENQGLMAVSMVFLVPVAEELLFRGLIFRSLHDRHPFLAHLVSILLFSDIHVMGYIGRYEPMLLLLCLVQYLPISYCLNFAYLSSGTIAGPVLLHMVINLVALTAMR